MAFSLEYFSEIVDDAISAIDYPKTAPRLFDPIKYTLQSGGKRLRPVLALAVFSALTHRPAEEAVNQAIAVELFHNFTLLHDDLMDNADLRRGRPTVHRKWGANTAILSGDAMLTLSSMYLAKGAGSHLAKLDESFNQTAMEVYEGQQLDMEFENRDKVSVAEYMEMIRLKTSVLLAGACRLGAIMADAEQATADAFYKYGLALGLAFQMRDDWLDTYGDPAVFGKAIGGDILNRKKTWLLITALNESHEELPAILAEDLDDDEMIRQVRDVYDSLNLGDRCEKLALQYSEDARKCIADLKIDVEALNFFNKLAEEASRRNH